MTPKTINTMHQSVACDVCGRTLLRGEHAEVYLAGGRRHCVCELCTSRAAHEGWIREGVADRFDQRRAGSESRRSLLGRLRARRERAAREIELPAVAEGLEPFDLAGEEALFDAVGAPGAIPASPTRTAELQPVVPSPHEPRHVRAVPTNAELKMVRALEVFNASEHPRTVAGVARSLGAPMVCVLPSPEHPSVVLVVVAWELSWYRYAVDLSDEHQPVQVLSRGHELGELGEGENEPNATADEQGILHLARAARRG